MKSLNENMTPILVFICYLFLRHLDLFNPYNVAVQDMSDDLVPIKQSTYFPNPAFSYISVHADRHCGRSLFIK